MKKIPTLFERVFEDHKPVETTDKVTPGMEWVLEGKGVATEKIDGSCCAIIDGVFFKRYDAKHGKQPPKGGIPCCDPDPVTGHWPHWVKVDFDNPEDKWFVNAYNNTPKAELHDGTYEAIGVHFQGNPYGIDMDILIPHGKIEREVPRSYEGIKQFLSDSRVEGLVFWLDGEPMCKIKRSDFGLPWGNGCKKKHRKG